MTYIMLFSLIISVLLCGDIVKAQACKDIDTSACEQMLKQRSDLCSDQTIAKNACPAFCKLCPIVCYHCNTTVQDYHLCKNTMTCPQGSVCMRKELTSVFDGHHEYELTCADKQECDHPFGGSGAFGKRKIESRDLSVTCCMEDLCNYHAPSKPTQATRLCFLSNDFKSQKNGEILKIFRTCNLSISVGCVKDLILVVDDTERMRPYGNELVQFLHTIVSNLPVNEAEVHVALGLFSDRFRPVFDLNTLHSKSEILQALSAQRIGDHHDGDSVQALNYVITHALKPASGDRPEASNVVLIMTTHSTGKGSKMLYEELQVHEMAEVIAVQFEHAHFEHLASDTNHNFQLSSGGQLSQIVQNVTNLIC